MNGGLLDTGPAGPSQMSEHDGLEASPWSQQDILSTTGRSWVWLDGTKHSMTLRQQSVTGALQGLTGTLGRWYNLTRRCLTVADQGMNQKHRI